jgi:hypothetical protein
MRQLRQLKQFTYLSAPSYAIEKKVYVDYPKGGEYPLAKWAVEMPVFGIIEPIMNGVRGNIRQYGIPKI